MNPTGPATKVWQRMWTRPASAEPDAADLGTCIGLEFSLDQPPALPPAPPPPSTLPGWVRRLGRRPRGSA